MRLFEHYLTMLIIPHKRRAAIALHFKQLEGG